MLTFAIEFFAVTLIALFPSLERFRVADQVVDALRATTSTPLKRIEVLASLVPEIVRVVWLVTTGTVDVTTGCAGAFTLSPLARI